MDKVLNFVAIDFETMTAERTSACAVGMAKVVNHDIQQKFYSLINPIPDNREHNNSNIHGITPEMVALSPTFAQIFPIMAQFIGNFPIVCHNRGADINILQRCMEYYGLQGINTENNICTYELTKMSLEDCCRHYHINMGCHHDALDDAIACAEVLLAYQGDVMADTFHGSIDKAIQQFAYKKYEHDTLVPLEDEKVSNQDTPFFHASVVITGTFRAYPNRNELGKQLQALGADINTAITRKTTVVVMGNEAGPAKIKKIEELRAKGHEIRLIYEEELKQILHYGED